MTSALESRGATNTGAGRDIGRAIAFAYAAEGAMVVVSLRTRSAVKAVADEIRAAGRMALELPCDGGRAAAIRSRRAGLAMPGFAMRFPQVPIRPIPMRYLTEALDGRVPLGGGGLPLRDFLAGLAQGLPSAIEERSKALRDAYPDLQ